MKTIVVTGATGFIGGAICIELKEKGYRVIGVDRVKRPHLLKYLDEFLNNDFLYSLRENEEEWNEAEHIVHCAGTSLVGPSVSNPIVYYGNNVAKTISLLDWCVKNNKHFLFSSSASVYRTKSTPLRETDDLNPLSPYAKSKLMIENVVDDYSNAYRLKYTIFRYFNACGAIGSLHGQDPGAEHIFPKLFEMDVFKLNGINFNTRDGTCIRDYIHIKDIASAHVSAIEKKRYGIYNLGSNFGYSNLEIINTVNKPWVDVGRRFGDSDCLIADNTLAKSMLDWAPLFTLSDIVNNLKEWYSSENYKRMLNV